YHCGGAVCLGRLGRALCPLAGADRQRRDGRLDADRRRALFRRPRRRPRGGGAGDRRLPPPLRTRRCSPAGAGGATRRRPRRLLSTARFANLWPLQSRLATARHCAEPPSVVILRRRTDGGFIIMWIAMLRAALLLPLLL